MGLKNMPLKSIFFFLLPGLLLMILLYWGFSSEADSPSSENDEAQNPLQNPDPIPQMVSQAVPGTSNEEDVAIQEQFDRDRRQQRQTKDLKIKLEQTNLELEEEKTVAQINKLKKENMETFNGPGVDGLNDLPDIRVGYIGGGNVNKEAILFIGSTSYQVKENSIPLENIRVVSISDSSVKLHFSAPQESDKIFDFKPE